MKYNTYTLYAATQHVRTRQTASWTTQPATREPVPIRQHDKNANGVIFLK